MPAKPSARPNPDWPNHKPNHNRMKTRLLLTAILAFKLTSCQTAPSAPETNPDGTPKPAETGFFGKPSSIPFTIAYLGKGGLTASASNKTGLTLAIDKRSGK